MYYFELIGLCRKRIPRKILKEKEDNCNHPYLIFGNHRGSRSLLDSSDKTRLLQLWSLQIF